MSFMDQASTLRDIMRARLGSRAQAPTAAKVVTITGDGALAPELAELFARQGMRTSLEPGAPDAEFIFLDCGDGPRNADEGAALSLYSPSSMTVLALGPEAEAIARTHHLVRLLRLRAGISRASVVVNEVTDGLQGREVFQKLKDVACRSLDVELEYLGHRERGENSTRPMMKRRFLLDWDEGLSPKTMSGKSLELVAKRLRMKCQEWAR